MGETPLTKAEFDRMKAHLVTLGYKFEIDAEGVERVYRPDGTLLLVARPQKAL